MSKTLARVVGKKNKDTMQRKKENCKGVGTMVQALYPIGLSVFFSVAGPLPLIPDIHVKPIMKKRP